MKKLSIIIPVYNVERYVRACLESVFRQGLNDFEFEVVLVNDGTKDDSFGMISDIINIHSNIVVFEQDNQGLSVARNTGFSSAKGQYVLFLDSDDLLLDNTLGEILEQTMKSSADMGIADFVKLSDEDIQRGLFSERKCIDDIQLMSGHDFFLNEFNPQQCYVWRTLYRKEFLEDSNIRFIPHIYFEDVPFTTECYLNAKKCIKIPICFYVYRQRENSIVSSISLNKIKDFNVVISNLWLLYENNYYPSDIKNKLMDTIFVTFSIATWYIIHDVNLLSKRKNYINDLKTKVPNLFFSHGPKQKLVSLLFKYIPSIYLKLRALFK